VHHNLAGYTKSRIKPGLYTKSNWPTITTADPSAYEIDKTNDKPTYGEEILTDFPDGFVKDFVLSTRGMESPTTYALWAALFGVSCAIQRRGWFRPEPYQLYPNLYIIFMAPPAINRKSTTVIRVAALLRKIPELFDDRGDRALFSLPLFEGTVTPEGLLDLLTPQTVTIYEEDSSEGIPVHLGSRLGMIVDELGTFLGKQKYNLGQITRLINLYDCKDTDDGAYTRKDGKRALENVFFNLFAATTPQSFSESIPEEAHGGGFLSRVILVTEPEPIRLFRHPKLIVGAPSDDDLTRKLAWIARFKGGEYSLTENADGIYDHWYNDYRKSFMTGGTNAGDEGNSRADGVLLRVATLIRIQAYTNSRDITADDFLLAIKLVRRAEQDKRASYELITPSDWSRRLNLVTRRLKLHPEGVIRHVLVQSVSRDCTTRQLDETLEMLTAGDQIRIFLDEQQLPKPHRKHDELYVWTGGNNDSK